MFHYESSTNTWIVNGKNNLYPLKSDKIPQKMNKQAMGAAIINEANDIMKLSKEVLVYRSSVALTAQEIQSMINVISSTDLSVQSDAHLQAMSQILEVIRKYKGLLGHLSQDRWLQSALNWPVQYFHRYLDGMITQLKDFLPLMGIDSSKVLFSDDSQNAVNRRADLKALKASLQNLMGQFTSGDVVGMQQQIERQLAEIAKYLTTNTEKSKTGSRPTCENIPMNQMRRNIENLLSQFKNINIEDSDLKIMEHIGAGGFGSVHKGIRLSTAEHVAIKELRADRLTLTSWASLYAEIEALASLKNQFVLALVGAHITEPFRIITRFCSGKSAFDRLHRENPDFNDLTPTSLTKIAYQVACGMEYLHSLGVVHRDLKSLNILLDSSDDGVVADFGLSGVIKSDQELAAGMGTPHYSAPEILSQQHYGQKIDVYSYGIVLWEFLTGKVPFNQMSPQAIYEHVVVRNWRLPFPADTPVNVKELISKCWKRNPNDRPSFQDIVARFEDGQIYFPGSEKLNFKEIKEKHKCPPIDIEYALSILRDPSSKFFPSLIYFLLNNCDEDLRNELHKEPILKKNLKSEENKESILLYSTIVLDQDEYTEFLDNGGFALFNDCITSQDDWKKNSAVHFALKLPDTLVPTLSRFIPDIVELLNIPKGPMIGKVFNLLIRFPHEELSDYAKVIAKNIIESISVIDEQSSFDAIVKLLPICQDQFQPEDIRKFHSLLEKDFVISSAFAQALIQANDIERRGFLIYHLTKASAKSDISDVLLPFLTCCADNDPECFKSILAFPNLRQDIISNINSKAVLETLFVVFCIAKFPEGRDRFKKSPTVLSIIHLKDHNIQKLQFITLCLSDESFCEETEHGDAIVHLLVTCLSDPRFSQGVACALAALTTHKTGCQLMKDKGLCEIFIQYYLSTDSDSKSIQVIKNMSKHEFDLPQASLIVSCLMQELAISSNSDKHKILILETLNALIERAPLTPQKHDLNTVILPLLGKINPTIVYLSLKLFSLIDASLLANTYQNLFLQVYKVLNNRNMHFTAIIEAVLDVLIVLIQQFDVSELIIRSGLIKFLKVSNQMIPKSDPHAAQISVLTNLISQFSGRA